MKDKYFPFSLSLLKKIRCLWMHQKIIFLWTRNDWQTLVQKRKNKYENKQKWTQLPSRRTLNIFSFAHNANDTSSFAWSYRSRFWAFWLSIQAWDRVGNQESIFWTKIFMEFCWYVHSVHIFLSITYHVLNLEYPKFEEMRFLMRTYWFSVKHL